MVTAADETGQAGDGAASARRLARLAFDLHDGTLQDLAVLAADLRLLRTQVEAAPAEIVRGRIDDALALVDAIETDVRDLARSLEPRRVLDRPLAEVVRTEAEQAEAEGIAASVSVTGDVDDCTASQRIALVRVVQESVWNIRQHSGAKTLSVEVAAGPDTLVAEIVDSGHGFDVARTGEDGAGRGRIGLRGMRERVRMLGGTLEITSRDGGPTVVRATIPRWRPPGETVQAAEMPRVSA